MIGKVDTGDDKVGKTITQVLYSMLSLHVDISSKRKTKLLQGSAQSTSP